MLESELKKNTEALVNLTNVLCQTIGIPVPEAPAPKKRGGKKAEPAPAADPVEPEAAATPETPNPVDPVAAAATGAPQGMPQMPTQPAPQGMPQMPAQGMPQMPGQTQPAQQNVMPNSEIPMGTNTNDPLTSNTQENYNMAFQTVSTFNSQVGNTTIARDVLVRHGVANIQTCSDYQRNLVVADLQAMAANMAGG